MDLKQLKNLCYSAFSVTSMAEQNERALMIEFIKEFFIRNSSRMKLNEKGQFVFDCSKKYVKIGTEQKQVQFLSYDPQASKQSSLSGISVITSIHDIAIENLQLKDINSIFVVLAMELN